MTVLMVVFVAALAAAWLLDGKGSGGGKDPRRVARFQHRLQVRLDRHKRRHRPYRRLRTLGWAMLAAAAALIGLGWSPRTAAWTAAAAIAWAIRRWRSRELSDALTAVARSPVRAWLGGLPRSRYVWLWYTRHLASFDERLQAVLEVAVNERLKGTWRIQWDRRRFLLLRRLVFARRSLLPGFIHYPARLPWWTVRSLLSLSDGAKGMALPLQLGMTHEGPLYRDAAAMPHLMRIGETRKGKSSGMRVDILDARRRGWTVVACDPQRVEFMGFRRNTDAPAGYEGIHVALGPEETVQAILWVEAQMDDWFTRSEQAGRKAPFLKLLLVIDEAIGVYSTLGQQHPAVQALNRMLFEAGKCGISIEQVLHRPDVRFLAGPARAQVGTVIAHQALEEVGSQMAFGDRHTGTLIEDVPGRALARVGGELHDLQTPWVGDPTEEATARAWLAPFKLAQPAPAPPWEPADVVELPTGPRRSRPKPRPRPAAAGSAPTTMALRPVVDVLTIVSPIPRGKDAS